MPMSEQDFESSFVSENQAISFEINMRAKRQFFLSKKGEREGEKTWVFHPRKIMAEAWSRMRRQSALSGRRIEMIFKNINIFREIALSEQTIGALEK